MYHISFDLKENECFIRLEGRIDSSNAQEVTLEMERAIPRQDGIKVIMAVSYTHLTLPTKA